MMKKYTLLVLCVICMSSIAIVFAISPTTFSVSVISTAITPITNIIFPTTPGDSSSVTTSTSSSSSTVAPSSTTITPQTQSGITSTSNTQTSSVVSSPTTIAPSSSTLSPITGAASNNQGTNWTTMTILPTTSIVVGAIGGVPGSNVFSVTNNFSPTNTVLVRSLTDVSSSKTSVNLGVTSPNAPTTSSISTTSLTVSPTSSNLGISVVTTLSRTSSSITGSVYTTSTPNTSTPTTSTPTTISPSTSSVSPSTTGRTSSVTPATTTLSRTTGQISGTASSSSSKTTGSVVGTQTSFGVGESAGVSTNTLTKTTGSISGVVKGSGTSGAGTLSKTSGSISGSSIDLSGAIAPTNILTKTSSSISGTESGSLVSKTISKTTGIIQGCLVGDVCFIESVALIDNLVAYKILDGPEIQSSVFSDNDLDSTVSNGDTITITFDQKTNKPSVSSKSEINTIFDFSESIGFQYSGIWQTPSKIIITLDDSSNSQLSNSASGITYSINNAGGMRNSENISLNSTASGTIVPEFNNKLGPSILSFVANDPQEDDSEISVGDTLTIKFAESTNRAGFDETLSYTEINSIFSFSGNSIFGTPVGANYTGLWQSNSTLIITIKNIVGNDLKIKSDSVTGTIATVTGAIKNGDGTSENSESVSPELTGSFGTFTTTNIVIDGGSVSTDLPLGTTAEIQLPEGDSGKITVSTTDADLEGDSFSISAIGNIVEFDPTDGASCIDGCTISFSFTSDEVPSGFSPFEIQIVHDANDDGDFDDPGEQLDTTVVEITPGFYTATAESNFTSKFAVGGVKALALGGLSGGGGSNPNYPSIDSASMISYGIPSEGLGGRFAPIDLDLIENPLMFKTNEDLRFSFNLFENQGINNIEHIGLYLNNNGPDLKIKDYDTSIVYDKYSPEELTLSDPNGLIEYYDFEIIEIDATNFQIMFDLTFSKTLDSTNFYVTFWDLDKNVGYKTFENILQISESASKSGVQMDPEPVSESLSESLSESEINKQIHVPNWIKSAAKWWATEQITDDEFVKTVEFLIQEKIIQIHETNSDGSYYKGIPSWIKNNAGWWADGSISNNEFVNSITYLVQKNIIRI